MGREIKRVPLDFDWPMKEVWKGFLNEHADKARKCPVCSLYDGLGHSPHYQHLHNRWYGYVSFHPSERGSVPLTPLTPAVWAFAKRNVEREPGFYGCDNDAITSEAHRLCSHWNKQWSHHLNADDVAALIEAGRLRDFTHTWTRGKGWQPNGPLVIPTPQEVNEWSISGFGHDAVNAWVCIKAECKRLGWPTECSVCGGEGDVWDNPEDKAAYDAWKPTEPPSGDGWQMWKTTTEGSPMSPVFASAEELARWLAETGASSFGRDTATYDQWLAMIKGPGWAPDAIGGPCVGLVSGVAAISMS